MRREAEELAEAQARANPRRLIAVIDYLLITTYDHGGRTPAGFDSAVELGSGVRVERLDDDLSERLLCATDLCGEDWAPTRQYHVVHAYLRTVWEDGEGDAPEDLYHWDAEERLYPCVQLSRLIRDNSTSTEHAVQRLIRGDGSECLVPFDGFDSHVAYRLYPEEAGWLDVDEAAELRALLNAYWNGPPLPDRVSRALRRVESVTRERYLEDALPLVVGGLESLVKIGREYVAAQFAQRVCALAAEVGVAITGHACRDLYDDRSALVHGAGVDLSQPHERDAFEEGFAALQETLRRVVRRALVDRTFASQFEEDSSITARWPAVVTSGGQRRTI